MGSDNLFETVTSRYGDVTFFANDTGAISTSLRKYGEWAENELSFMRSMVREGDTVIDVGAYIGTHSLAFASYVGPAGHVISIEPQSRSFELLKRNVEANGLKHVQLENAIASSSAHEELIPSIDIGSPGSYGSESLRDVLSADRRGELQQSASDPRAALAVKSIALDELNVSACALIKIDVEGMEDMVLQGAAETIRRWQPSIYAECNCLEDGLRTFALLKKIGYKVRAHVVRAYNPDNFRQTQENLFGPACEVALVGTSGFRDDPLHEYELRPCELLLDIETADDLALALMNKPQYEGEVLRRGAAATSGGDACLNEVAALRTNYEQVSNMLRELETESARQLDAVRQETRAEVSAARNEAEQARRQADASRAQVVALENTLAEINASPSWRVISFIRGLRKTMRGSQDR
jgi:FkbM family methyltransferase